MLIHFKWWQKRWHINILTWCHLFSPKGLSALIFTEPKRFIPNHSKLQFRLPKTGCMKLSQDLCISFWLRQQNKNKNNKATILLRVMIAGEYKNASSGNASTTNPRSSPDGLPKSSKSASTSRHCCLFPAHSHPFRINSTFSPDAHAFPSDIRRLQTAVRRPVQPVACV